MIVDYLARDAVPDIIVATISTGVVAALALALSCRRRHPHHHLPFAFPTEFVHVPDHRPYGSYFAVGGELKNLTTWIDLRTADEWNGICDEDAKEPVPDA